MGFVSFPNSEIAKKVGGILINFKYAACVKVVSNIESMYLWEGNMENETEVYLVMKTLEHKIPEIKEVLDINHPYAELTSPNKSR